MADVFISYSQKTPEPAKALAARLAEYGYEVWWDTRLTAGDKFDDVIREKLDEAEAVVVVWTAESVRSKYVRMEAGTALAWGKKLIPVRVADLMPSEIPAPFGSYQTVDAADLEGIRRALEEKGVRPQAGRRKALSREELIAQLGQVDGALPASVDAWLRKCQLEGFRVVAKRSLMIKATIPNFGDVNFGTLFPDGTIQTNYISESSERVGDPSIAGDYLDGLARLIEGASVRRDGTPWNWRVEVFGQLPRISSALARSDEWLALMKTARERFTKAAVASASER